MTRNRLTPLIVALAPAVMIASVGLSGCAMSPADDAAGASPAPGSTPPGTPSPDAADEREASTTSTPIVFEIDGQQIAGRLDASPTAVSLASQLPLTLQFADHGGQEKYAELPEALDLTGAPQRSDAEPLQIGYYVPDQRLILYYEYVGTFAGIVPIGSYDDAEAVERQRGEFTVTIRAAE